MEKTIPNLSEKNDHARPVGEGPKRAWFKPRIRTLTVAFTMTGSGWSGQTREEDTDNPSTDGYSPDS